MVALCRLLVAGSLWAPRHIVLILDLSVSINKSRVAGSALWGCKGEMSRWEEEALTPGQGTVEVGLKVSRHTQTLAKCQQVASGRCRESQTLCGS